MKKINFAKINHVHAILALLGFGVVCAYLLSAPDDNNKGNAAAALCQGGIFCSVTGILFMAACGLEFKVLEAIKQEGNVGVFAGLWCIALALSMWL